MEDILVPTIAILAVFGTITAIIVGPTYLKTRERRDMQDTIRAALEKGQPLPPEVIDALSKDVTKNLPSRTRDLRRGVLWLATGIGIGAFSVVSRSGWNGPFTGDDGQGLLGIACVPVAIGIAFIILSFFNPNKE